MSRSKASESFFRLLKYYKRNWTPKKEDCFKGLIRTILSQNTNWKHEENAFNALDKKICVNPKNIAEAEIIDISDAIKTAGARDSKIDE